MVTRPAGLPFPRTGRTLGDKLHALARVDPARVRAIEVLVDEALALYRAEQIEAIRATFKTH